MGAAEALGIGFCNHGLKSTDTDCKIRTDYHGILKFRGFRKSLATSTEMCMVGDEVVLTTTNLCSYCPHLASNMKANWVGPFSITQEISPVAYGLDLPSGWKIHPVSHFSKLKHYIRSEEFLREVEPSPPVLVGDTLEYEVEGILRHQGKGVCRQYFVLWKGYPLHEAT